MGQGVMMGLALACSPSLLIAAEPTTGLDVTTQAAIMDLIRELAERTNMATLLITHDLALAAEQGDRIVVMHAGHVVAGPPAAALVDPPPHPSTPKLVARQPRPCRTRARSGGGRGRRASTASGASATPRSAMVRCPGWRSCPATWWPAGSRYERGRRAEQTAGREGSRAQIPPRQGMAA